MKRILVIVSFLVLSSLHMSFQSRTAPDALEGAWQIKSSSGEQVLLFADGYFSHTVYDLASKKFISTRGGSYELSGGQLHVYIEFDTQDSSKIGHQSIYKASVEKEKLKSDINGVASTWTQLDKGGEKLHGLWTITGRKQEGKMVEIRRTGTRKTIKLLTATRFQWAAIDPGTKQFMGTGGGRYEFENGKYVEHIEFFSRDHSRAGQSLQFEGKIENGDWHHSGFSSKGDPIYEVWSRKKNRL